MAISLPRGRNGKCRGSYSSGCAAFTAASNIFLSSSREAFIAPLTAFRDAEPEESHVHAVPEKRLSRA